MKKLLVLMTLMITLLSGCGKEKSLNMGLMPDIDSIPLIIAEEKGFFKEEGVSVKLVQFKSAMERDAALQSGNLDGAISDILAVIFARSGGFSVVAASSTDGRYTLVSGNNSGINSVHELAGRETAVSKNTIIEYITDKILDSENVSADAINKVTIPQIPARLELLQAGKLDSAALPEPMGAIAEKNGARHIKDSSEIGLNPGIIVFSEKSAREKKASIQAMYRAYNKAVEYLNNTARNEYIETIIKKNSFPDAAHDALVIPKYRNAAPPSEKDIIDCIKWMVSRGAIKNPPDPSEIISKDLLP